MILKGNQRGGARDLAVHLLKCENEQVEIHQLRGFMADDLKGAFAESEAIARGTRCKQFLFSLSLNPPQEERVPIEAFTKAADEAEKRLGLKGQPRAIVFHEKEGPGGYRRHAHVVWSRIDATTMTAINLPFYKTRLRDLSRELYLDHGWDLPEGLQDPLLKSPLNFDQAEWQQAMRTNRDPREIKKLFQQLWERSDSAKAFGSALESYGYKLARGDRRGFVAVEYTGEIYSLTRWIGLKAKQVKERLGDPEQYPSVAQAKSDFREQLTPRLKDLATAQKTKQTKQMKPLVDQKRQMAKQHKTERQKLRATQCEQRQEAQKIRQDRFNTGLRGLWDRVTGRHAAIARLNRMESWQTLRRDQRERDDLIFEQLTKRQELQQKIQTLRHHQRQDRTTFARTIALALRIEGRQKGIEQELRSRNINRIELNR